MILVIYLSASVLLYALVARRLATTLFSAAMVFALVGILAGPPFLGLVEPGHVEGVLERFLEATLVLVLFSDAFAARNWDPRTDRIPIRLLAIGMPLTIALGGCVAAIVFPDLGIWEAAALGAILAPTDAALGSAVVTDRRLPVRIRQALNVESGLNDGLSLPFLVIFVILAGQSAGFAEVAPFERFFRAIVLSGSVGVAMGFVGTHLLMWSSARGWTTDPWTRIAYLAIAVGAFAVADKLEGSGFIAAWIAGFVSGRTVGDRLEAPTEFVEGAGSLLMVLAFFTFGAIMVAPLWGGFRWVFVLYALLSLTLVRMLPVGLSLIGSRLRRPTLLFVGWFGPRGLASLVFGLLVLPQNLPGQKIVVGAVAATVLLSIALHGATAVSGVTRYAGWFARASEAEPDLAESRTVAAPPVQRRPFSWRR